MLSHLEKFLKGGNNDNTDSLNQGKKFNLMQYTSINNSNKIIEGQTNMTDTTQPNILYNLDNEEMGAIQKQIDNKSQYNKLLSDCGNSVRLYNDELAKRKPDYNVAESLRQNMTNTCNLLDYNIRHFRNNISNLEKQNNDLGKNLNNNTTQTLQQKLIQLKGTDKMLSEKMGMNVTLNGEIENNELITNSEYIKYFAWMFASFTMASIVVQQLLKK